MQQPSEMTQALRAEVFAMTPAELGVAPSAEHPQVWGVLMETGDPEGTVTLLALLDGTVSLYFSIGGGFIGAGAHESVRREAFEFIGMAERYLDQLMSAQTFPLPAEGRVQFYVLTFDGPLTVEADEQQVGEGQHKLSTLFYAGHDVITAIRQQQESADR